MRHKQAGSSRGWLLPALLSVVALVAATSLWLQGGGGPGEAAQPVPTPGPPISGPTIASPESAEASPQATTSPRANKASKKRRSAPPPSAPPAPAPLPSAGVPRTVVVESLGINAPVVAIAAQGTSLDPPADPQVLGWWSGGAPAGAATGTALVTGHTVNAGGGAMDNLENVRKGAEIRVTTPRGTIRYVAESVQVLDKVSIARQAQQLFSQEVEGRLVLVTCEDWDGTGYRSNVVVTAVPA